MSDCEHDERFHLMKAKNGCCACELEAALAEIDSVNEIAGCPADQSLVDYVRELQAQLADASPGTPRGRLNVLARYAEEHLGHSPVSARPAEVLVLEEIERLQVIEGKLPTTADGVPVVPGAGIVYKFITETCDVRATRDVRDGMAFFVGEWYTVSCFEECVSDCFSTREAAEAAGKE